MSETATLDLIDRVLDVRNNARERFTALAREAAAGREVDPTLLESTAREAGREVHEFSVLVNDFRKRAADRARLAEADVDGI